MEKQPIFVTYANASLRDNPEIFWHLYEQFVSLPESNPQDNMDKIVRALVDSFKLFAGCESGEAADAQYELEVTAIDEHEIVAADVTRGDILKWGREACFDVCDECNYKYDCGGGYCYQKLQALFKVGLARTTEVGGFFTERENKKNDISYFEPELNFLRRIILESQKWFKLIPQIGHKDVYLRPSLGKELFYPLRPYTPFHDLFLKIIVGSSLINFLDKNTWQKLKVCPFCQRFFIADDIRQTRCKDDNCRKAYERQKKQKQREEDPAKYM